MTASPLLSDVDRFDPRNRPGTSVFLELPKPRSALPEATSFRTTWLASSLTAIRNRDLIDRYRAALDPAFHEIILGSVAGQWAPVEVAHRHYEACDKLGLAPPELRVIGGEVTQRVHGSILSTFVKLAKESGVTPWNALGQLNRLWAKIWEGGGVCVYQVGPKDAIVEIAGWPFANVAYIQGSMPGVIEGMLSLFCRRVYARCLTDLSGGTSLLVAAQ